MTLHMSMAESPEWIPLQWDWTKNATQSALNTLGYRKREERDLTVCNFSFWEQKKWKQAKVNYSMCLQMKGAWWAQELILGMLYFLEHNFLWNSQSILISHIKLPSFSGALQTLPSCVMNKSGLRTAEATFLLSKVCLHRHTIWMEPFSIHNS